MGGLGKSGVKMNKQAYSKIGIAITSIILTFAASNEHLEPTYLLFGYIENFFGMFGLFMFYGITTALIYLVIYLLVLRSNINDAIKDALKVALVCYILVLLIWGYIYLIFRPE